MASEERKKPGMQVSGYGYHKSKYYEAKEVVTTV